MKYGWWPQYFWNGRQPHFFKWKKPHFFLNGRGPQLFWKWKTTSNFINMKLDLIFFWKWKMTSIVLKWKTMGSSRQPRKLIFSMQPYLNEKKYGIWLQYFWKWKTTSLRMKHDLILFENGRQPTFFRNGSRHQFIWKRKTNSSSLFKWMKTSIFLSM
jgi:hypothetical protein